MSKEQASERAEVQTGSEDAATPCCENRPEASGTCGGSMEEMMRACPCATAMKRHRIAVYTTLAVMGFTLLVLQAGWILGVVAFFRTY